MTRIIALILTFCFASTAYAVPPTTTCTAYTLLSTLSDALQSEQGAKKDMERAAAFPNPALAFVQSREDREFAKRFTFKGAAERLEDAAKSLVEFKTLLFSTLCPPGLSAVVDLCFASANDAESIDKYLATVIVRNPLLNSFASDHDTQLNLLGRAIEMKKDCLQALITEGIVNGTEQSSTTTPP